MAGVAIVVRLQFEGVHYWPDAPLDKPEHYLRHAHRHVFHVEAVKRVTHEERDIEIIAFKREMLAFCEERFGKGTGAHPFSCETLARILLEEFGLQRCSVLEDNENGAEVTA